MVTAVAVLVARAIIAASVGFNTGNLWLGFNMGTEIPAVFPKQVTWVWVQCTNLVTTAIPYL